MSQLSSLAHKLLMLPFLLMLASLVRIALKAGLVAGEEARLNNGKNTLSKMQTFSNAVLAGNLSLKWKPSTSTYE